MRMKKVAFIINSLQGGGAERTLSRLTMALPKDWEIDIILSDISNISYEYRGNIIDLGIPKRMTFTYFVKSFLKRLYVLSRLKRSGRYDACVGFIDSASIANILTGNKYCKVVTTVRTTLSERNRNKGYRYIVSPLVKLLYNKSDVIVAVSEGVKSDLINNYGIHAAKVRTIYNGYDFRKIDMEICNSLNYNEQRLIRGKYTIVTMGRLDAAKGQWNLIRAFSNVVKEIPDITLLILGEGKLEQYLRELTAELDLEDKVVFGGLLKNPFHILAKCDIFVFPSLYEGFPNAMIEAMYCGLPVIATDFKTGAREILAPETSLISKVESEVEYAAYGILTPVCDGLQYRATVELSKGEILLAEAMKELLRSEELREKYAMKAKERSKIYDIDTFCRKWMSVIER